MSTAAAITQNVISRGKFPEVRNKRSPFRRIGPKSIRSLLKSYSWPYLFPSPHPTGDTIIYFPEDIKVVCHKYTTEVSGIGHSSLAVIQYLAYRKQTNSLYIYKRHCGVKYSLVGFSLRRFQLLLPR